MKTGSIVVTQFGIEVCAIKEEGARRTEYRTSYDECTLECLEDAARILGVGLGLSSSDPARECQRVHDDDQLRAALRDMVDGYAMGVKLPDSPENP